MVPNDTSWFDANPHKYLGRKEFREFARVAQIDLEDLLSDDLDKVKSAQEGIVQRSVIFNEIQKLYFGFSFPLIVYTHDFELFEKVPNRSEEMDKTILGWPMCDSLRRRHIALSHVILPKVVDQLYRKRGRPVVVKNLGSGIGLDSLQLLRHTSGRVSSVLNYETDFRAIDLGLKMTKYLEDRKSIETGVMQFVAKSLTKSVEPADLIVKVGVICGLRDPAARMLLASDHQTLREGGKLVLTSSNVEMRQTDPLANFMIQHIGTREDPKKGWGLNFRTKAAMLNLLANAGFSDVRIYDDSNYPGKEGLPNDVLYGVDTLPARALGYEHSGKPINLPPQDLAGNIGYNWIAVATKGESHVA